MMETGGNFIRGITSRIDPNRDVVAKVLQIGRNLPPSSTDVLVAGSVLPRPSPDCAEHPLVEATHEPVTKDVLLFSGKRPRFPGRDVVLLPTIQFGPSRYMREAKAFDLARIERRCPVRVIEVHAGVSHKSLGIASNSSSTAASIAFRIASF